MGTSEKNKYTFPCGESVCLNVDAGYAFGLCISQKMEGKDETGRQWRGFKRCKECSLDCKKTRTANYYNEEYHTSKIMEVTTCIGYSKEYLKNKDKETVAYLNTDDVGKYVIELVIQDEEFRTVKYLKGTSKNCGLLSLLDETFLEDFFEEDYDKETDEYRLWMTNMETGQTTAVEYEDLEESIDKIVSARFLQVDSEEEEMRTCTNRGAFDANVLIVKEKKD